MPMTSDTHTTSAAGYPGFHYTHEQLYKYAESSGIFSIMLQNKSIVHFIPEHPEKFKRWLKSNHIFDIKAAASN
ncbi:hypothetical protein [Niabella sp.]|uniref:hypothetical protein n=1 Tax=Niabella sp. TaxID=1962976 RepID=UPI00261259FC|nr:hypothetical protein [Niabella sp.]